MKTIPDIVDTACLFNRDNSLAPIIIARSESRKSADITPKKTGTGGNRAANTADAICVLSPHSEKKSRVNPERNGFRKLLSCFASEGDDRKVSRPKIIKRTAVIIRIIPGGSSELTTEPKSIADP